MGKTKKTEIQNTILTTTVDQENNPEREREKSATIEILIAHSTKKIN